MGDPKGFLKLKREKGNYRPVCERVCDYADVSVLRPVEKSKEQASRCMDCGTPFCHWGCPVGNLIPEWNEAMFQGHWEQAVRLLTSTNNLPEITGRICPAPCEFSCVLGINDDPVTIRENELSIIEYGFKHGIIKPRKPYRRTKKKVAVVGSGPAGLAAAMQLNSAGHSVTVFEKDDKIGGILRYGIPDFKLEKWILDRRIEVMKKEGVVFKVNTHVGETFSVSRLKNDFDAICLAGGSRKPRDLNIEGRNLKGVCFAMDYLIQANKKVGDKKFSIDPFLHAQGKKVVVIGGGDTGADCMGIAHRQKAACVVQIELMPKPASCRTADFPWPKYPMLLKSSTSHEEGGERHWSVSTKKFIGENGVVKKLSCVQVQMGKDSSGCPIIQDVAGSNFEIEADLVILALGFLSPEKTGLLESLGVEFDKRGNVQTDAAYMTSVKSVFAAGDMHRGQSLIVWAVSEGRSAAHHIDRFLMGDSSLPRM